MSQYVAYGLDGYPVDIRKYSMVIHNIRWVHPWDVYWIHV